MPSIVSDVSAMFVATTTLSFFMLFNFVFSLLGFTQLNYFLYRKVQTKHSSLYSADLIHLNDNYFLYHSKLQSRLTFLEPGGVGSKIRAC